MNRATICFCTRPHHLAFCCVVTPLVAAALCLVRRQALSTRHGQRARSAVHVAVTAGLLHDHHVGRHRAPPHRARERRAARRGGRHIVAAAESRLLAAAEAAGGARHRQQRRRSA
eukprot:201818-Chlamydomonas_euryale.AAC.1